MSTKEVTLYGKRGVAKFRRIRVNFPCETEWASGDLAIEVEIFGDMERRVVPPVVITAQELAGFVDSIRAAIKWPAIGVDEHENSDSDLRECDDPNHGWDGWQIHGPFAVRRIATGEEWATVQVAIRTWFGCNNPGHWERVAAFGDEQTLRAVASRLRFGFTTQQLDSTDAVRAIGFDVQIEAVHHHRPFAAHYDEGGDLNLTRGQGAVHLVLADCKLAHEPWASWALMTVIPGVTGVHSDGNRLLLAARSTREEAASFAARAAAAMRNLAIEPRGYIGLSDERAAGRLAETVGVPGIIDDPVLVAEILRLRHAGLDLRRAQLLTEDCIYPDLAHVHSDLGVEDLSFEWDADRTKPWLDGRPCEPTLLMRLTG